MEDLLNIRETVYLLDLLNSLATRVIDNDHEDACMYISNHV